MVLQVIQVALFVDSPELTLVAGVDALAPRVFFLHVSLDRYGLYAGVRAVLTLVRFLARVTHAMSA